MITGNTEHVCETSAITQSITDIKAEANVMFTLDMYGVL